jgi:hypothetical protein
VLPKALQVTFDCLANVRGGFRLGLALGNASRQSRAGRNKNPVLVWLETNAILHQPHSTRAALESSVANPSATMDAMTGIQFVTDEKGRKVAIQIDLKKYGAILEDFWDGLVSESRRKEKGIPFEKVKADLVKRGRLRA